MAALTVGYDQVSTGAAYSGLKALCTGRRSVRQFSGRSLTAEQITAIREIARTAPYASGKKNWDLLVVTDRDLIAELAGIVRERSQELGNEVRDDFREMFAEYSMHFAAFATAPALFFPVFKVQCSLTLMLEGAEDGLRRWERDNYVKSIAGVTMLIQLAAESLGLGACCMTGPLLAEEALSRRLALKPGFEIGAVVPVGYAKGEAEAVWANN